MENFFVEKTGGEVSEYINRYLFLERYVNDGSPSKYGLNIPFEYDPFNKKESFDLPIYIDKAINHVQIGQLPPIWTSSILAADEIPIPIHPAVEKLVLDQCSFLKRKRKEHINVQPTASGRTVFWTDDFNYPHFIKLHYPNTIGRFRRDLSLYKWISTIEKAKELFIQKESFPKSFSFLYDFGGIFARNSKPGYGFGSIFRDFNPIPHRKRKGLFLVPSFSLIAKKQFAGRKRPILVDLI